MFLSHLRVKIMESASSSDLFTIEKSFLEFLGIWPGSKMSIKRIFIIEFVFLSLAYFPICNNSINMLMTKDYLQLAQTASSFLVCNFNVITPMLLLKRSKTFQELIKMLNEKWFKGSVDEFPEWNKCRTKAAMKGNKFMIFVYGFVIGFTIPFLYLVSIFNTFKHIFNGFESPKNITLFKAE